MAHFYKSDGQYLLAMNQTEAVLAMQALGIAPVALLEDNPKLGAEILRLSLDVLEGTQKLYPHLISQETIRQLREQSEKGAA